MVTNDYFLGQRSETLSNAKDPFFAHSISSHRLRRTEGLLSSVIKHLHSQRTLFKSHTWWHIGEVAASQRFGRGSNFQVHTSVSAGILPLSRQYARYLPYGSISPHLFFVFCLQITK